MSTNKVRSRFNNVALLAVFSLLPHFILPFISEYSLQSGMHSYLAVTVFLNILDESLRVNIYALDNLFKENTPAEQRFADLFLYVWNIAWRLKIIFFS